MREIILCITSAITLISWFVMIKNVITNRNLHIILYAIHEYNCDVICGRVDGEKVDSNHMAGYCRVLFRFWDWSYKNILPKEEYELIKNYIK